MSKIALSGDASGTGTFTIASPNSNSNFTLTLPAENGTIVTGSSGLDATNLTSGTIPKARMYAGAVLQVGHARKTDTFSTANTALTNVTGLSVTLTPASANSKFLVRCDLFVGAYWWTTNGGSLNATATWSGGSIANVLGNNLTNSTTNYNGVWVFQYGADATNTVYETVQWVDSNLVTPGTTNPITFQVQIASYNASYAIFINKAYDNTFGPQNGRSSLTVMEIAG